MALRACEVDDECEIVTPGCPLGCSAAVHKDSAKAIQELATQLITEIEKDGSICDYKCPVEVAKCNAGMCSTDSEE